ncbi:MAG TPA: GAF domain-containing protein, partial [Rubrivivax sp.]|nr:GAF domain-containing protein [Rubrivivax sp.]
LPLGEAPQPLLQAVTPWLAEAQHTRLARLRHGPEGAMPLDQRSCVVAPLIAQRRLLGYLYADIEGVFGRFADSDRDLLALLATQAAVALANLRASEGLEAKVAERTALLEQRAGELAVINTIQQGVAQSLDFGAIVELVGDKLREVFHSGSIHISWVDEASGEVRTPYACEQGRRVQVGVVRPKRGGPMWTTLAAGGAVVANDAQQMQAFGLKPVPGTTPSTATAIVPVCGGGRLCGAISVQHHDGRSRFDEAEVRLLGTVATSMGTALENVRLFSQTKAALERQTATAEVLQVLSGSVVETAPVFDKILEGCARLFDSAEQGIVLVGAGGHMELAAHRGPALPKLQQVFAARLPASDFEPIILRGKPIHIVDIYAPGVPPMLRDIAEQLQAGPYSQLIVPMAWEGRAIGLISVIRHPPEGFSATEIAQLQTFANQAVIALQNARLFNDTKEALERQTASAGILRVLSASPSAVKPVFDAITASAWRLLGSAYAVVLMRAGDGIKLVSLQRDGRSVDVAPDTPLLPLDPEHNFPARVLLSGQALHLPDWSKIELPPHQREIQADLKIGSSLTLPLRRDGECIGVLGVGRIQAQAFAPREIALLESFADQAVIAIGNVRLFNETREALERQTASHHILKVMAASPGDVQPVFDAIVADAKALTGATTCHANHVDGEWLQLAAFSASDAAGAAAMQRMYPLRIADYAVAPVLRAGQPVLVADAESDERVSEAIRSAMRARGVRSTSVVPMMRGAEWLGNIVVNRAEPGLLDERRLELLRGFADQAVIALENARLFNETKEALERQTATAEILRVISGSVTDTQPVFEAIVAACQRLFDGMAVNLVMAAGDKMRRVAEARDEARHGDWRTAEWPLDHCSVSGACVLDASVLVVHDRDAVGELYPRTRELAATFGWRSGAFVPLLRHGKALGCLGVVRETVGDFSQKEIALAQTFADQAVIAIENARLFNETKEALDQQRASAEVLTAISNSIADTQPVFDVILQSCQRLFASETVGMTMVRADGLLDFGAYVGPGEAELRKMWPRPLNRDTATGRAILDQRLTAYEDVDDGAMPPASITGARAMGLRSMAFAPMVYGGHGIGSLWIGRKAISRFPPKELALLQTFADQAVIAIQNARLFNETREALV